MVKKQQLNLNDDYIIISFYISLQISTNK